MSKLAHSYQPTMDMLEMQRCEELYKSGEMSREEYITAWRDFMGARHQRMLASAFDRDEELHFDALNDEEFEYGP